MLFEVRRTGRIFANALAVVLTTALFVASANALATGTQVAIATGDAATPSLPAVLVKPNGEGPFPAIVILHDCSGLGLASSGAPRRWAAELATRGYVSLLPDSFAPRGHVNGICTVPPRLRHAGVVPASRAGDARAALAYLRTLQYVDGQRIGVMGGSHGGASTLAVMADLHASDRFNAGAALYPACAGDFGSWRADLSGVYVPAGPVKILIGELDDWTPARNCRRLAEVAQKAGHPVTIKVYPDAHHSFDNANPVRYVASRVNANAAGRRGATTGGHPGAWADSIEEVVAFFGRHLGGKP